MSPRLPLGVPPIKEDSALFGGLFFVLWAPVDSALWHIIEDWPVFIISLAGLDVPKDGSFVTMTSTVNIPGVTANVPESVLKVTELHNPTSRDWSVYNVFNMTPLENLWHISNGVDPVIIEASVTGTGPDCAAATAEAWDGQIISVDLVPDALSDLEQQYSGNPITPIE